MSEYLVETGGENRRDSDHAFSPEDAEEFFGNIPPNRERYMVYRAKPQKDELQVNHDEIDIL